MRAVVFHGPGRITCEEVPDPEVRPDSVIVRVSRCGICGGDVSMTSGGAVDFPPGSLLGHECAGEVVAVGREVTRTKVGDRVGCAAVSGCGRCPACLEERPNHCLEFFVHRGGFSDYVGATERGITVLPASLSMADGALVEPMACGLRALRQAGLHGGERILILGAGSMALSVVFWARRLGAGPVAVASRSGHRAETAYAMGADAVIAFDEQDPDAIARALGGPPDIVVECVGKPGMLAKSATLCRPAGTVISMGLCGQPDAVIPGFLNFKEIRLLFPVAYSLQEFEETARAFDSGQIRPEIMVSEVIGLDEAPSTIESLRTGQRKSLKIQVDPSLGRAR